ncbi:MAG: beta-galactosidase [Planctomycetia bacterium]|nr:beta-galactosidase [Planctomycetia bacterium]
MLKQISAIVLSLFLLLPAVVRSAEIYPLDFNAGVKKVVPSTLEVSQKVDLPGQNLQGYKFSWDTEQSSYIEMAFNKPIKLPEFNTAIVRAKMWAPVGTPVSSVNIRLRDKNGEIFQFRKKVSMLAGGFFDLDWRITPNNAEGSWGPANRVDKKIDMPAQIVSIVVSYFQEISSGSVYMFDLNVEPLMDKAEENIEAARPLALFDDSSLFRKLWGIGDFSVEDHVLLLKDVKSPFGIWERKFEITRYEKHPVKLVLDTDLAGGEASLSAVFVYAYGSPKAQKEHPQRFTVKPVMIKQGRSKTVLEIDDVLKDAQYAVRLSRIDLIPKGKKPVQLKIHRMETVIRESAANAVDFDILTDHRIPVLSVGAEDQLKFRFTNRANKDGQFQIDMKYENYFGEQKSERFDLNLKAGESLLAAPKWRPDSLGHWTVEAQIKCKGKESGQAIKSRSLAWIKPAGPTRGRSPGFLFSVCTHTERWSPLDRQLEIEAAALCGIKVARVGGFGWAGLEPKKGEWNWTLSDELVKNYGKNGIEAQVILWGIPSWASPEEIVKDKTKTPSKNFPADINDWQTYIQKISEHFKGKIRYYEIWNEPDLKGFSEMSLDQYAALQKAAYEEIKKADPGAFVLTGGFATLSKHPGLIYQDFQKDYLIAARNYYDIHAIHEHGWFAGYKQRLDELFFPMRKETKTAVPWYSNETAMTSVGGLEKRQAQTLFKKLLFAWIRGSIGYTWYDLRNDGYDPVYGEHHFGMITNDFYPKEVYSVHNMLASHFRNMKGIADHSQGKPINLFSFGDGTDILIPGWCETNMNESHQMMIRTDAKSAKIIDLMGNEKPAEVHDSIVVFEIGSDPRTLKLEKCTFGKPIGELLIADENPTVVPGRKKILKLTASNPADREIVFDLAFNSLPSGMKTKEPAKKIKVPASGKMSIPFEFEIAKDFQKSKMILPLNYSLTGTDWKGFVYIPIRSAIWIGSSFDLQKPNFVLNRRDQITSTTPADPSNAHRLWTGPEDLSAKVWLAGKDQQLLMRFEVEDDKDVPNIGSDFEKGDQARFCFQQEGSKDLTEIAFAKNTKGQPIIRLIKSTAKISQKSLEETGKLAVRREGSKTIYEFSVPFTAIGLSEESLFEQGIRLDFQIGDDDGEGVDSWLHFIPDFQKAENIQNIPLLFFEKLIR